MKLLFDHGTPVPLAKELLPHEVKTAYEMGWAELSNGELLAAAEGRFDLLVTTDRNLRYQQNLRGRALAILVLPTTSWRAIRQHAPEIAAAVTAISPGELRELTFA